jgi:hypothetical protein
MGYLASFWGSFEDNCKPLEGGCKHMPIRQVQAHLETEGGKKSVSWTGGARSFLLPQGKKNEFHLVAWAEGEEEKQQHA